MRLSSLIAAAFVLVFAVTALAHGTGEHFMGTVKAIDATSITLETKDGHSATAVIDDATKFERDDKPAKREDVKIGERAAVHTNKVGESLHAVLVKLGKH